MKFIFIALILFPTFCSGEFKNINCIYSKDFSVIVQFDEKKQLVKFEKFKTVNKDQMIDYYKEIILSQSKYRINLKI
jgi:hypothetical protein